MKRFAAWGLLLLGVAALGAAVYSWRIKPRAMLEEARQRHALRRAIAAHPFVRAKTDSGYALVTGRRCAPLAPDSVGVVEFCLEKKAAHGDVLYTFERYGFASGDSTACAIRPSTANAWECAP